MNTESREIRELKLLFDISRTMDKHTDIKGALGAAFNLLETRLDLLRGMLTLVDKSSGLLRIAEALGVKPEILSSVSYRMGEGLVGRVFESARPLVVPDLSRDNRFLNKTKSRSKAELAGLAYYCVPLLSGNKVLGTLSAERIIPDKKDPEFLERDTAFLEKLASVFTDHIRLREKIIDEQEKQRSAVPLPAFEDTGGRIAEHSPIIGTSKAMKAVFELVTRVAPSDATVLITGESGTGKELIAEELFRLSRRSQAPFIRINCAALPESIVESELFGHEKGAFTGAQNQRKGHFERAQGGTIFLDEIGELSPNIQAKLLRVLQEREIERLGGSRTIKVDVRLITATNRNLEAEVEKGRFRQDLYYRLNVFPIHVPPLRDRRSDIILLADYFTEKYGVKHQKPVKRISTPAIDLLMSYSWPGNVRELENCIERGVILSTDMVIHSHNLPPSLQSASSSNTGLTTTLEAALSRLEKELIVEALKMNTGNMAAAARQLGITERQMGLRVHHYGINWRLYRTGYGNI